MALERGGDQRAVPDRLGSREGRGSPADRRGAKADHRSRLAAGFSHGFLVSARIGLLALTIALAAIRVTREDLSGVDPMATPVG